MDNLRGFNNKDNSSIYNNIFGLWEGKRISAEADLVRAQALADLANKPAQGINPLIFIIPAAGLLVFGVIFIVISKRRKK